MLLYQPTTQVAFIMKQSIFNTLFLLAILALPFTANATTMSLQQHLTGHLDYKVFGASELIETHGLWTCQGTNNNSASVTIPGTATIKAAYLYWYVMESNLSEIPDINYLPINNSATVTLPAASSTLISSTRNFTDTVYVPGLGNISYAGRYADITSQIVALPNPGGRYRVDVEGGASTNACAYNQENVRAWNIIIIYEDPATVADPYSIYIHDGMVGFIYSNISVPVTGYQVLASPTFGSMTVVSVQGDTGIPGEYMNSSDPSFPSFPSDFAHSNAGASLDISKLTGNFTGGSTSMNLNAGSNQDLILLTNVILKIPDALAVSLDVDYGDAPASYGDTSHTVTASPSLYLGSSAPDIDASSTPSANADADDTTGSDDEDALTYAVAGLQPSTNDTIDIVVQGTGFLNVWIDWNQDGDFADISEQVSTDLAVSSGTHTLTVSVPGLSNTTVFARARLCSAAASCHTSTGSSSDGEVEDHLITIAAACVAFNGEVSEIGGAIPQQVSNGDKTFLAANEQAPSAGHYRSYTIDANDGVSPVATDDAATAMTTGDRATRLFSSEAGSITQINALADAAFARSGTDPSVADIKAYTINPSSNGGTYLAGRKSGSLLGTISRGNDVAMLTQHRRMSLYLSDPDYRSFYSGTINTGTPATSRSEKALVNSDDGFLYAFEQSDLSLAWGWMPPSLVSELKNYSSFQATEYMRGKVAILDTKDVSGNYASFVVGAYKNGLGHYVLKLNASGGLDSVIWDTDENGGFIAAPNHGAMDYFYDLTATPSVYIAYILTNSSNVSKLVIRHLSDNTIPATEVLLNFEVSSTPFVMPIFGPTNAPAAKMMYLGDSNGNIHRAALLDGGGALNTAATLKAALESTLVGNLNASEPILHLGAAMSAVNSQYYLRAQSDQRITVLNYNPSSSFWEKSWTSAETGTGAWLSGTFTADNSGPPTDVNGDGFFSDVPPTGIQSLQTGATISAEAAIVSDSLLLPVSVSAVTGCTDRAYLYLYGLTNGQYPDKRFFTLSGSSITTNIELGFGNADTAQISDNPGQERMLGFGHSTQNADNTVNGNDPFVVNDSVATGIRGWKQLGVD